MRDLHKPRQSDSNAGSFNTLLCLFHHIAFAWGEEVVGFQSVLADVEVEVASHKAKRDSWVPRSTMYPPSITRI